MRSGKDIGVGAAIALLSDDGSSGRALALGIGKVIRSVVLKNYGSMYRSMGSQEGLNRLEIRFEDGTGLVAWDGGQSCCESRYMHTDDDLGSLVGDKLCGMELKDGPTTGDVLECQFLEVKALKGHITIANYNDHNGYYGGFAVQVRELVPEDLAPPEPSGGDDDNMERRS